MSTISLFGTISTAQFVLRFWRSPTNANSASNLNFFPSNVLLDSHFVTSVLRNGQQRKRRVHFAGKRT